MIDQIEESVHYLKSQGINAPEIGVILGTGLGNAFVDHLKIERDIHYADIPHFPEATVEYHHGRLLYGDLAGKKIVAMQGRFHYYEGYSLAEVTFPVRVLKMLGIKYLLVSNAAGNMNPDWNKGNLMLIDDHINLLPDNPLRGVNDNRLGPRFPDMSAPYDAELIRKMQQVAEEKNIDLKKGVYVAVMGPNLETRAEYRFLRIIGADAVGMSTVPEVIVAHHMSLPVLAISVLTDDCDPDNLEPANIDEIIAVAGRAEKPLTTLFMGLIERL
ncbi:purine-nucleoside phosphorylase [Fulvivirga sedimenti]|uniref:Purine nucleoside phosphorylase n=1 Tax=Fulvivirga sedimenti TaxID=2879465 RepID=A0A9X1HX45_9BACT|nr:purine-nucleoside phosphorylase [Fulvivirga sedimenti]MCA6079241.1 purine-nucleoside phosphorylase [Fulvivirga sedimenti]